MRYFKYNCCAGQVACDPQNRFVPVECVIFTRRTLFSASAFWEPTLDKPRSNQSVGHLRWRWMPSLVWGQYCAVREKCNSQPQYLALPQQCRFRCRFHCAPDAQRCASRSMRPCFTYRYIIDVCGYSREMCLSQFDKYIGHTSSIASRECCKRSV